MAWVAVGLGVGGAVLGGLGADRKRRQTEAYNKAQAEITRYSPWTGMHGELQANNNDWFNGALQGGVSGAMMGQSLGKAGAAKPAAEVAGGDIANMASVPGIQPAQYGASPLGGDQMAQQLGQAGNNSAFTGFDDQNIFQRTPTNRYALLK